MTDRTILVTVSHRDLPVNIMQRENGSKRRIYLQIALAWTALLLLNGCTAIGASIAMHRSTDHLLPLSQDGRVFYENGAESLATSVASILDQSLARVEAEQHAKFEKDVVVYVLNSVETFASFCVHKRARGCVLNERLFISPIAKDVILGILTHELSHLQMEQFLGMWHWHSKVPPWFSEGLAVFVSSPERGGAETVSRKEALLAISNGQSFRPNKRGSLLFPKTASSFGLELHMFYAQSELFVKFLHDKDNLKFKSLLSKIRHKENFSKAILTSYNESLTQLWVEFTQSVATQES